MADNVSITAGAGTDIAADDVGSVFFQKIKLDLGTDGVSAPALAGAGAVATGVQRITLASDDPAVTALQLLDNAVDGNYLNVNANIAGTDMVGGAGAVAAGVQRVTLASDDPAVVDLAAIEVLLGTIDADTTALFGCVAGTELQTDVLSIVPGVGATNLGKAEDAAHATGDVGVMLLAVRDDAPSAATAAEGDYTPLLTNATGHLYSIDPTANALSSTANGILTTMDADTGAIKLAVEIMDDWDAVHDSAASTDGPQIMAAYDSTKPTAVADGDALRVLADSYGRLLAGVEPQRFQAVLDSADATAEANVVHASAVSTVIVVQSYVISSDVEGWIKLQDEDSTALTGKFWLKAGGGVAITLPENSPIVLGADKDLEVICEAAGNVSVSVTGYTIPG